MKVPPGMSEDEVFLAINNVVSRIGRSAAFGPYELEDIRQEAWVAALELLDSGRYDGKRRLENFVYTHVRNRVLLNLKRDKLHRRDPPCWRCAGGDYCGEDGRPCKPFAGWHARNRAKANLLCPGHLENVPEEQESVESGVVDRAQLSELRDRIDRELPAALRATYLRMVDGASVPKARRLEVEAAVRGILGCPSEDD